MKRKRSPQSTRAFSFWESCHWPHATIAVERISFVHWQLVHKLATVQVPSPPRNFSLWNNPKQQDGVSRVSEECTIEKRWATCIADYNKYMGGIDCTDQLLKPYEVPRKHWSGSRRWPSTLCSFPCSTSSLFIRRVVIKNNSWDFNMKWLQHFSLKMEMVLTWRFPGRRTSYDLLSITLCHPFQ